jgi:hypothetical protein
VKREGGETSQGRLEVLTCELGDEVKTGAELRFRPTFIMSPTTNLMNFSTFTTTTTFAKKDVSNVS